MTETTVPCSRLASVIEDAQRHYPGRHDQLSHDEIAQIASEVGIPPKYLGPALRGLRRTVAGTVELRLRDVDARVAADSITLDARRPGWRSNLVARTVAFASTIVCLVVCAVEVRDRVPFYAAVLALAFSGLGLVREIQHLARHWRIVGDANGLSIERGISGVRTVAQGKAAGIQIGSVDHRRGRGMQLFPVMFLEISFDGQRREIMQGFSSEELRFVRSLLKDWLAKVAR